MPTAINPLHFIDKYQADFTLLKRWGVGNILTGDWVVFNSEEPIEIALISGNLFYKYVRDGEFRYCNSDGESFAINEKSPVLDYRIDFYGEGCPFL